MARRRLLLAPTTPLRSGSTGALLVLLTLLLHRLDELPDQVPGLPLHLDGLRLVRAVHLQEVLYLPDIRESLPQELYGTLLLLLLLLTTLLLLLSALLLPLFCHGFSFPAGLRRSRIVITYPVDTETRLADTPALAGVVCLDVGGGTKTTKGHV